MTDDTWVCNACGGENRHLPSCPRLLSRSALFWAQIEQAAEDVAAWPYYLRYAMGVEQ